MASLDSVSLSALKHCTDQQAPVFAYIFNASLELCRVPACFTASIIIPIPKKAEVTGLNDYRPVALTSVVMKVLERIVLAHLKSITDPALDSLQFAYRANRSMYDAVNMALHYVLEHLDTTGNYARILFVDFSSELQYYPSSYPGAPAIPAAGTSPHLQVDYQLPDQQVSAGEAGEEHIQLQVHQHWLPTGLCPVPRPVLPVYEQLHLHPPVGQAPEVCRRHHPISRGDESAYRREIVRLQSWCSCNNLELNAQKTVEMVVNFRKNAAPPPPIILGETPVAFVESCRFLGLIISQDLKWE